LPYSAEISRTNPTAILFLLDQSSSMLEAFGSQPEKSKADGVAEPSTGCCKTSSSNAPRPTAFATSSTSA
jgi:hypothetical protein